MGTITPGIYLPLGIKSISDGDGRTANMYFSPCPRTIEYSGDSRTRHVGFGSGLCHLLCGFGQVISPF